MGRRRVEASIWACWQQRRPVFSEILPRRISKTISMKISVVSLSTENELVRNVLLAVLASLAKLEREMISQRMKAGLETSDRKKLRKPRLAEVAPVDREAHAR
jgi:DNA invertase Pin-like site-specific DNA recombinase